MNEPWSRTENEAAVADYFDMLRGELLGQPYVKAEHRRRLGRLLNGRSEQAIEFKHCNISACLLDLGCPAYIEGYQPRGNYQQLLHDVVMDRLEASRDVRAAVESRTEAVAPGEYGVDILQLLVDPPRPREKGSAPHGFVRDRVACTDYSTRESHNRALGDAGELFVLQFERARLARGGAEQLADRVEHVAKTRGDGIGYDIASFEIGGTARLIEVKTTNFGQYAPFYVSRNELLVSQKQSGWYFLYRLFDFHDNPRLFTLPGALSDSVDLDPSQYIASFR